MNAANPNRGILHVGDMHCASCVARLEHALQNLHCQFRASVATRTAEVTWIDASAPQQILNAIHDAGFQATWIQGNSSPQTQQKDKIANRHQSLRMAISALLSMQVMMLAVPSYFGGIEAESLALLNTTQWLLATPVVFYGGWPFILGAWRSVRAREPRMDLTVGIAITLAYVASVCNVLRGSGETYFDSATMFVTLLSLGRWFEARGRNKAAEHLTALLAAQPATARRMLRDRVEEVAIQLLEPGDVVEVLPGDAAPVDGVLMDEYAELSEAIMTGESLPVYRAHGEVVAAGSVLVGRSPMRIQSTARQEQSTVNRIAQLSHHAMTRKSRFILLTDRISALFISTVLLASLLTFLFWRIEGFDLAFSAALAVLVASCPCALSLAAPVALAAAVGRLASKGILVVNTDGLLRAADVDTLLLDKTGTLTSNQMRIVAVKPALGVDPKWAQRAAAGLEVKSRHPIARAFADIEPLPVAKSTQDRTGILGEVEGRRLHISQISSAQAAQLQIDPEDGLSWVCLSDASAFEVALCAFGIESDLAIAFEEFQQLADLEPILVSGDAPAPTQYIAEKLGIRRWKARQSAAQKLLVVDRLHDEAHCVMALGDGANDAALLAAADCSVAMGHGAALAQCNADLVLLDSKPSGVMDIIEESRRTNLRVKQNMAWAIAYNVGVFPLAFSGLLVPWVAALGMSLSSLVVLANALRRRSFYDV